jgi:hypothetical protein
VREKPKTGGWSQSAKLIIGGGAFTEVGGLIVLTDLAKRLGSQGLKFQADFTLDCLPGERPAEQYSVSFCVTPPTANPFVHVNPIARISFSTRGNSIDHLISVGDGTSISGICETLSLRIFDATVDIPTVNDPITGLPVEVFDMEYIITVTVAPLPRPDGYTPPIFFPVDNLQNANRAVPTFPLVAAAGAVVDTSVPVVIGQKSIMVMTALLNRSAGGSLEGAAVEFRDQNASRIGLYCPNSPVWVPIPPTTHSLRCYNTNGVGQSAISFTPIFGIDG